MTIYHIHEFYHFKQSKLENVHKWCPTFLGIFDHKFFVFSVYPKTQSGVNLLVDEWDFDAAVDNAPEDVKEIFHRETLAIPDNTQFSIDLNEKVSMNFVFEF